MVRRLRPLAQQTVDAELARAMRLFATRHLQSHLSPDAPATQDDEPRPVALPAGTVRAVQGLVGAEGVTAFVTAATERELHKRTLDALRRPPHRDIGAQIALLPLMDSVVVHRKANFPVDKSAWLWIKPVRRRTSKSLAGALPAPAF